VLTDFNLNIFVGQCLRNPVFLHSLIVYQTAFIVG